MTLTLRNLIDNLYNEKFGKLNILEAGAHGPESVVTLEFVRDNNVWYMEPEIFTFDRLVSVFPQSLNLALSDCDGVVDFTISSHGGNSSIKHSEIHKKELESYNAVFENVKVNCITYSSLLKKLNLIFDILVLDIEGHEVPVLKSMQLSNEKEHPKIIVIECGYDWNERLQILKEMGYCLDVYWENNCVLSKNIETNPKVVEMCNQMYNKFEWFGQVIYNINE